jgi:hypothetical protein
LELEGPLFFEVFFFFLKDRAAVSKLEERSIICEQIQSTPCDTREVAAGRRNFQTAKLKHKIGRTRVFGTLTSKEGAMGTAPKTDTGAEGTEEVREERKRTSEGKRWGRQGEGEGERREGEGTNGEESRENFSKNIDLALVITAQAEKRWVMES